MWDANKQAYGSTTPKLPPLLPPSPLSPRRPATREGGSRPGSRQTERPKPAASSAVSLLTAPPTLPTELSRPPAPTPPPAPLRPDVLIEHREQLLERFRTFAVRWSHSAAPGGSQPPLPNYEAGARASTPVKASAGVKGRSASARATHAPATTPGSQRCTSADLIEAKLARCRTSAYMGGKPLSSPMPPSFSTPQKHAGSPRGADAATVLLASPMSARPQLTDGALEAGVARAVESARMLGARLLAEIVECTLQLVEALAPSLPEEPPPPAEAEGGEGSEGGEGGAERAIPSNHRVLSERWVTWALQPRSVSGVVVPPAGIRTGVNYLLQALIDFHRLPLPTASDPMLLRWFEDGPHGYMRAAANHPPERLKRMAAAEMVIRSMLTVEQNSTLCRAERSPVGRSDEAWRAVALLLYGGTGGYTVRQRELWAKDQAALRMQLWLKRSKVTKRVLERRRQRVEKAVRLIQLRYRERDAPTTDHSSALFNASLQTRREARKAQRAQEAALVKQRREQRRLDARRETLRRRRHALRTAMVEARVFYKAHNSVGRAWRTAVAKRFLSRVRMTNATARVGSSFATQSAAIVWQARFRSWSARGKLVFVQGALCDGAASCGTVGTTRKTTFDALRSLRSEAEARQSAAQRSKVGAARATDEAVLAAARETAGCAGRLLLLRAIHEQAAEAGGVDLGTIRAALRKSKAAAGEDVVAKPAAAPPAAAPAAAAAKPAAGAAPAEAPAAAPAAAAAAPADEPPAPSSPSAPLSPSASPEELRKLEEDEESSAMISAAASAAAAAAYAEMDAAINRGRGLDEKVETLNGAASLAEKLCAEHAGAAELLLGVEAHLLAAADGWTTQHDSSVSRIGELRATWLASERAAAAARQAVTLETELALFMSSINGSGADADGTAPRSCKRRGSFLGTTPDGTSSSRDGPSAKHVVMPMARLSEVLREAEVAEATSRRVSETLAAEGAHDEWVAAVGAEARAKGEVAIIDALDGARLSWDGYCEALRMRELKAVRLASTGVKLAERRAAFRISECRGAKRGLKSLLDDAAEALRVSRAHSVRSAVQEALALAEKRHRVARMEQDRAAAAKRVEKAFARAQKKGDQRGGGAAVPTRLASYSVAGNAGGGGGGGAAALAAAASASAAEKAAAHATADGGRPSAAARDSSAGGGGGGGADASDGADADGKKGSALRRAAVAEASGEAVALRKLVGMLPPSTERLPSGWLEQQVTPLLEQYAAAEGKAKAEAAQLAAPLAKREEAKAELRSAAADSGRKKMHSAMRKLSIGFALGKAGSMSSMADAAKANGTKKAPANDAKRANSRARDGGAASGAPGGAPGGAGSVPGCLEAERLWERGHVLMALARGAAARIAEAGRGPVDGCFGSTWAVVGASLQLRPQSWLANPQCTIGSDLMLAAAQQLKLGLRAVPAGESPEWPLVWMAIELLRAPLPDGWSAAAPAGGKALPKYRDAEGVSHDEHPLLGCLIEEVDIMRRRLRLRWRMYRQLEAVWLFASESDSAAGTFHDLESDKRSEAFPSDLLAPRNAPKASGAAAGGAARGSSTNMYALLQAKRAEDRRLAEDERKRQHKEKVAAKLAALESQTRTLRREALRTRPRSGVELMHAARALHIDLLEQPELAFVAHLALCTGLSAGWELAPAAAGGTRRYRNLISSIVTTTHPLVAYVREFRC